MTGDLPSLQPKKKNLNVNSTTQNITGNNNIAIGCAGGDVNISIANTPPLHVTRWNASVIGNVSGVLDLLKPQHRATEMIGRDNDLNQLWQWLHADKCIGIRTVTGGGGAGKTRLAIELLRKLEAQPPDSPKWLAGFCSRSELQCFMQNNAVAGWNWRENSLVIFDYAAGVADLLKKLLPSLSKNQNSHQHKLRILLLEREASTLTGWLAEVQTGNWSNPVKTLFDPLEPVPLAPLSQVAQRRQLLQLMLDRLEAQMSPSDLELDQCLTHSRWADPLYLLMAAMLARQGDILRVLNLPPRAIAEGVAEHERSRIAQFAGGDDNSQKLLLHLAAIATLRGGLAEDRIIAAIEAEASALHRSLSDGSGPMADLLRQALPGSNDRVSPILPDLLGEAVAHRQLKTLSASEQKKAILRAIAENPLPVADSILRICHDYASGSNDPAIDWLDAYIDHAQATDPNLFLLLWMKMPDTTTVLRPQACKVVEQCLKLAPDDNQPHRARLIHEYANRLGELGQRQQALALAQEAVTLYRQLAQANPDAFLPYLSMSLNSLANRLGELGQRQQALAPAQEAVDIRRQLAQANPDAFLPDLSMSLNNLANRLSNLGQRQQALALAQEAVDIRRQLAQANPDAFLPYLASSLNNLAAFLSGLGQRQQALAPAQEAVDIQRQLAQVNPDAFIPDLAGSLNNLAAFLSELGQRQQALAHAQEAVTLYRQLAQANPDAFLPDLSMSLNNLANRLSDLGQRQQALAPAQEAVKLYRQLAQANPDAFRPNLAMSLNNLASFLSELGQRQQALAPAQEAVKLYRQLAQANPDAFRPNLAMSLNNLANRLSDLGQRQQALAPAQEAVKLYRQLAQANPDAFRPNLAMSLNNLASFLSELGQRQQALAPAQEAVTLYRQLAQANPDAFLPGLAMSYGALGSCLRADEQLELAAEAFAKGVRAIMPPLVSVPQAFAELAQKLRRNYLETLNQNHREPDMELLAPVVKVLEEMGVES